MQKFEQAHTALCLNPKTGKTLMASIDHSMKQLSNSINNQISQSCSGKGLIKSFPDNNLQLMVTCKFLWSLPCQIRSGVCTVSPCFCVIAQTSIKMNGKLATVVMIVLSSSSSFSFIPGSFLVAEGGRMHLIPSAIALTPCCPICSFLYFQPYSLYTLFNLFHFHVSFGLSRFRSHLLRLILTVTRTGKLAIWHCPILIRFRDESVNS